MGAGKKGFKGSGFGKQAPGAAVIFYFFGDFSFRSQPQFS